MTRAWWATGLLVVAACSGSDATIPRAQSSDATSPTGGATSSGGGRGAGASSPPGAPPDAGAPPSGPWPGSSVILLPFGVQKSATTPCGAAVTDLEEHLPAMYGTQYDLPDDCIAWAEALTIGIDAHVTNYENPYASMGIAAGGFYVMNSQMAFVTEPAGTKLANVASHVPASLHGSLFQNELVDSLGDWNDTPTFILDEWVVYTNGATAAVELGKAGKIPSPRDGVSGALELTLYALAFGASVEPATLSTQLLQFLAWNAERAMDLYRAGAAMPVFSGAAQASLYSAWKTSADAVPLRNFARRVFGGPYVTKVLEIGAASE